MKPSRLKEVKDEIRILGVAIEKKNDFYQIIGVIYRGKKFLDHVIKIQASYPEIENNLINEINNSSNKSQIRCLIFHYDAIPLKLELNFLKIFEETKIPLISIFREIESKKLYKLKDDSKSINFFGINFPDTKKILKKVIDSENIPEAVRVANLILKAYMNPIT
ncbi:hypothetical protein FJY84_03485 [Candidatus Bathyarchaeota archaeon]|nr:hypothetical protein [Candidatus Bathyarchaeota archaeon]